jgi:RNA dependent RNA polymerase
MAGCKGLVIIDPASTTEQYYIKIRPSMKKFDSDQWDLEICEPSKPSSFLSLVVSLFNHPFSILVPTRLNNQIIILMSDLGIPDSAFLNLQQKWLTDSNTTAFCTE